MARQLKIEQPFDLELSLTMGQAFRWRELPPDFYGDSHRWFSGVIGENLVHIRQADAGVEYRVGGPYGEREATAADDELLRRYFRLDDDIDVIYASIARDPKMDTIMREFPGLRLLRQDPWECLLSQLCAQKPDAAPIGETIEHAAKFMGSELRLEANVRYAFPTPDQLLSDHGLAHVVWKWLLGSEPAWNIIKTTKLAEDSEMNWSELRRLPYEEVKQNLRLFPGVSDETADRISLFALDKLEAFPVDYWVWRAIIEAYPEWGFPEKSEPTDHERHKVAERARQEFGEYAGYANQYLFYWRRQHGEEPLSFAHRWHGKFRLLPGMTVDDVRYEYLSRKYLS